MELKSVQITVITAIYNKSKYLDNYVQSLKEQKFQNFEVICVEDCSTDDSMEHLKRLVSNDNRFIIISNNVNSGASVSRNNALKISRGKYVCFLDPDDCFTANTLEVLWNTAEKFEVDGLLFSASEYSEDLKKELRPIKYKYTYPVCDGEKLISLLHERSEYQSACGFQLWKLEFIKKNEVRFYPNIVYEDTLFTLEVLLKAKRVMAISDILYIYRKCSNSISHSLGVKQLYSCLIVYNELLKMSEQYFNNEWVYLEIINRLNLFKRRIQHVVCTEQKNIICSVDYGEYNYILQSFFENISYPYIRQLSINEIDKLKKTRNVYIYGDGIIAEETIALLNTQHINIKAVIVSYVIDGNEWHGYKMIAIDDFFEKGIVVISVTTKWRKQLEKILHDRGNETIFITQSI